MSVLFEDYDVTFEGAVDPYGDRWAAQTFEDVKKWNIVSVAIPLYRTGDGANVTVSIRATSANVPTGSDLCVSSAVDCSSITTNTQGEWITFTFTVSYSLSASTRYAIVARSDGSASHKVNWVSKLGYTNGSAYISYTDAGETWQIVSSDYGFRAYGDVPYPADNKYSKCLVAIGNSELWYESPDGTMKELEDAVADLDSSVPLDAVEAYQKLFIVNGTNLKVADFGNTKLTTGDIKPTDKVIPLKGTTLTGGTSKAEMIVDYIDASDSTCNVYGYRTTTATFVDTETVTGTVTTTDDVTFVLNANENAPPHWYNWTVYSGDTATYGTMPTSSSLISLYRGRIVINDNNNPHAWYMTKVGDPWKCKYDYDTDGDLSAVTYTSTTVGVIGDINSAFISYKDDLFIFGCANSIWVLVGDPLGSGQLAKVTGTTGIWENHAWCIDDKSNLYFLGEDGIYRMPISQSYSPPENISKIQLPNLIADLDLDKSLHRVTVSFDPIKYGIIISRTLLSDGTNTGYWYDLTTKGFYPESYPISCGIFSSVYYSATDDTYKKFLVGCNDGYIREFDNSTKDDTTTSSTDAIDSYFAIVNKLSQDEDMEGKMIWLNSIMAGGGTGGDFSDTDGVTYSLYTGDDAETILEKVKAETAWADETVYTVGDLVIYDSVEYICITAHTSDADGPPNEEPDTNTTDWLATAFATGTWTGTGKQTKNRIRMRGGWYGLKLRNNTDSETWAINSLYCNLEKAGKLR